MKCELCHENDAETAIQKKRNGVEDELYVCKACAKRERLNRQKRSQRTRKSQSSEEEGVTGLIESLIDVFNGAISRIDGVMSDDEDSQSPSEGDEAAGEQSQAEEPKFETLPCGRAESAFRIGSRLHLEGLHLTGDLEAVKRAFHALEMELEGVDADGMHDVAHVYSVLYRGSAERAKRVVENLLAQERNARCRLIEQLPRVLADSLCRSLAILKNCRILAPAELFDLLSPIRLGLQAKLIDGIGLREVGRLLDSLPLDSSEDMMAPEDRDRVEAERADMINARFEDVMLNEKAEGLLK